MSECVMVHYETITVTTNQFTKQPTDETPKYNLAAQKAFRQLAIDWCANHEASDHSCLPKDKPCMMMERKEGKICEYFRRCVLPLDPALEAKLGNQAVELKKCEACGKQFEAAGRQVYCSELCRQKGSRAKEREKKKRQRKKQGLHVPI